MEKSIKKQNDVFIKISNNGEIDKNAFSLLGASSKRNDDSKIGFFGSGLKYAIAVLLKNKIRFKIFSGNKEIEITCKKLNFRGNSFDVIYIDGKKTSLTTDMGPSWKEWFAIREIYCNALDENDGKIDFCNISDIKKCINKTIFYIEFSEKLHDLFNCWNNYFSEKRKDKILEIDNNKIFYGKENDAIIYRKGVKCYNFDIKSLYNYDLDKVKINESRIAEDTYDIKARIVNILSLNATDSIIINIFDNYKNTFEGGLYWDDSYFYNDNWLKIIGNRMLVNEDISGYFAEQYDVKEPHLILPQKLILALKNFFKDKVKVFGFSENFGNKIVFEPDNFQKNKIKESINFFKKHNIKIDFSIKISEPVSFGVRGEFYNNTILLSPSAFDLSQRELNIIVLEEYYHGKTDYCDCTRNFQSFLLNEIMLRLEHEKNDNEYVEKLNKIKELF